MAIKEAKPIFFKIFSIVLVVLLFNFAFFAYKYGNFSQGLTGFSVKETLSESYSTMSFGAKIFFIVQWIFLLSLLLIATVRDKGVMRVNAEAIDLNIQRGREEDKTDLDTLYEVLIERKELPLSVISKSFDIDKETALDWCKILESGGLVVIDYPGFGEPVIRINEKEIDNEKEIKNIAPQKMELGKKMDVDKEGLKIKNEIENSGQHDDKTNVPEIPEKIIDLTKNYQQVNKPNFPIKKYNNSNLPRKLINELKNTNELENEEENFDFDEEEEYSEEQE